MVSSGLVGFGGGGPGGGPVEVVRKCHDCLQEVAIDQLPRYGNRLVASIGPAWEVAWARRERSACRAVLAAAAAAAAGSSRSGPRQAPLHEQPRGPLALRDHPGRRSGAHPA